MINSPKTKGEAKKYKYGGGSVTSFAKSYDPERCAYEVAEQGRAPIFHQCRRGSGYGAGKLYCKQHAKQVPAEDEGETKWIVSIHSRYNTVALMEATVLSVTNATVTIASYRNLFNSGYLNKGRNNLSTSDTTLIVYDDLRPAKNKVANIMKQWIAMKRQEITNIEMGLQEVAKL